MLDRIHKISEIVAAFALIGSLIFVGVQIGQNTDATRISNEQAAFQTWSDQGMVVATNDRLSDILTHSMYPEARAAFNSDSDLLRLQHYIVAVLKTNEVLYLQWRNGHLSDDVWNGYRSSVVMLFASYESFNETWNAAKDTFSPEFSRFMDERQQEGADLRRNNFGAGTNP